jgi:hypothetical protein
LSVSLCELIDCRHTMSRKITLSGFKKIPQRPHLHKYSTVSP